MAEKTTYPNPNRPPKKYTKKSLHGRTRVMLMSYKDFRRYQNFIINVFGWDMIEMPEGVSMIPAGDPNPGIIVASGPAQYDYEGVTPGHMNLMVVPASGDELDPVGPFTEISMDDPLEETVGGMLDRGAKLILDRNVSNFARELDDSKQSWQPHAVLQDPAGNVLYLWKCPSSRTWDELETEYDVE